MSTPILNNISVLLFSVKKRKCRFKMKNSFVVYPYLWPRPRAIKIPGGWLLQNYLSCKNWNKRVVCCSHKNNPNRVGSIMHLSHQMALQKHCSWCFSFWFGAVDVLAVTVLIAGSLSNNSSNVEKEPLTLSINMK